RRGVVKMTSGCFSDTGAGFWSITPQYGNSSVERSGAAILSRALFRQVNPPVVADFDAGRDHDFPGMVVGIGEIAGVTAIIGLVRGLQQRRAAGDGEIQHGVGLLDGAAIPGERR